MAELRGTLIEPGAVVAHLDAPFATVVNDADACALRSGMVDHVVEGLRRDPVQMLFNLGRQIQALLWALGRHRDISKRNPTAGAVFPVGWAGRTVASSRRARRLEPAGHGPGALHRVASDAGQNLADRRSGSD